jgi:hypothetical protein
LSLQAAAEVGKTLVAVAVLADSELVLDLRSLKEQLTR